MKNNKRSKEDLVWAALSILTKKAERADRRKRRLESVDEFVLNPKIAAGKPGTYRAFVPAPRAKSKPLSRKPERKREA